MKIPIVLRTPDRLHAIYLNKGGRSMIAASSTGTDGHRPSSPPFHLTGLTCYDCYAMCDDMPEVLWLAADRLRRKALRTKYRARRRNKW